jgi:hypothetical protein
MDDGLLDRRRENHPKLEPGVKAGVIHIREQRRDFCLLNSDPVREHTHAAAGPNPMKKMMQGAVVDPFGNMWLIGKILE